MQIFTEIVKAAGYDSDLVTKLFEGLDYALGTFGESEIFGNLFQDLFFKTLEKSHPPGETFFKIDFALHGGFGDSGHFFSCTGVVCQHIDDFTLDQGGIHVEHHQPAGMTINVVHMK